jgi:predicted Zn-dependent peptidase
MPWTHSSAVEISVRAGAIHEKEEVAGASHFLEHLRCRTFFNEQGEARVTDEVLGDLGTFLDAYTGPDHTSYCVQVRPERLGECLAVLGRVMAHPDLSPDRVRAEKKIILSEYDSGTDDPADVENVARESIWRGTAMGRPAIGTLRSIRNMDADALVRFDGEVYIADNIVLTIAGSTETLLSDSVWKDWESIPGRNGERGRGTHSPETRAGRGPSILFEKARRANADLVFAYPAFPEGDRRLLGLNLLRHILHKRLMDRFQGISWAAYDIWVRLHTCERAGLFFLGARVTGSFPQTVIVFLEEMKRIAEEQAAEAEVERAKEWDRTYLVQLLDRPEEYAARLGLGALYGTSLDPAKEWKQLGQVSPEMLREIAAQTFHHGQMTFCLLGHPNRTEKNRIRRLIRAGARSPSGSQ